MNKLTRTCQYISHELQTVNANELQMNKLTRTCKYISPELQTVSGQEYIAPICSFNSQQIPGGLMVRAPDSGFHDQWFDSPSHQASFFLLFFAFFVAVCHLKVVIWAKETYKRRI